MNLKVKNGSYIRDDDSKSLQTVDYIEQLIQNVFLLIHTEQGHFYPNKNFGIKIPERLMQSYIISAIRQAIDGVDGVFVKSLSISEVGPVITFIINGQERTVYYEDQNL